MNQPAPPPKTIAFLGVLGVGNLGNEASLAAMLARVRRAFPSAHLLCICLDPERVAGDHGISAVGVLGAKTHAAAPGGLRRLLAHLSRKLSSGFRALKYLKGIDTLIVPGTGVLDDFGTGPLGWSYDLLVWCAAARLRGVRIAFACVGAGPIRDPLSKCFMATAARLAHSRSYRDEDSKQFMRSIGLDVAADEVVPDIVFSLPVARHGNSAGPNPRITVAVGVMAYYGWSNCPASGRAIYETYIDKISLFTRWLLEQGFAVRLVTGETTDQCAVTDVMARLGPGLANNSGMLTANPIASFDDLLREMSAADLVVATRFHNVVAAILLAKPVISLGYAKKNEAVLKGTGLEGYCQHVEKLDLDQAKRDFEELVATRAPASDRVAAVADNYRRRLEQQFSSLFESIPDRPLPHPGNPIRHASS